VPALTGIRRESATREAAIELEWRASNTAPNGSHPFDLDTGDGDAAGLFFGSTRGR